MCLARSAGVLGVFGALIRPPILDGVCGASSYKSSEKRLEYTSKYSEVNKQAAVTGSLWMRFLLGVVTVFAGEGTIFSSGWNKKLKFGLGLQCICV